MWSWRSMCTCRGAGQVRRADLGRAIGRFAAAPGPPSVRPVHGLVRRKRPPRTAHDHGKDRIDAVPHAIRCCLPERPLDIAKPHRLARVPRHDFPLRSLVFPQTTVHAPLTTHQGAAAAQWQPGSSPRFDADVSRTGASLTLPSPHDSWQFANGLGVTSFRGSRATK